MSSECIVYVVNNLVIHYSFQYLGRIGKMLHLNLTQGFHNIPWEVAIAFGGNLNKIMQ